MLRRALWGILVAVLLAVAVLALMGPRWMASASNKGKELPSYSMVPDFELQNRDGSTVRREDLDGSPWVADFVFTHCQVSCPVMTSRMAELRKSAPAGVRFVSVTVDPDRDTPEVLQTYAENFDAGQDWYFLTGSKPAIYTLVRSGFSLGLQEAEPGEEGSLMEPITHSSRFVLVDGAGVIRGYYDAFDAGALSRLQRDLRTLAP